MKTSAKRPAKKLTFKIETLRSLDEKTLGAIVGASGAPTGCRVVHGCSSLLIIIQGG